MSNEDDPATRIIGARSGIPPAPSDADSDATVIRVPSAPQADARGAPTEPPAAMAPPAPARAASAPADAGHGNMLPVGTFLAEFELTEVLGEGGFGIVYLARDHSLHRRVALKEYMPSSLAARVGGDAGRRSSRSGIARRSRPACTASSTRPGCWRQFDHPSLVKVYRFWEANGTAYMVMPFYEGITLKQKLKDDGRAARRGLAARPARTADRGARGDPRRAVLPPRHRAGQRDPAEGQQPAAAARLRRRTARDRRHDAGADGDPQARLRAGRAVRRSAGHEAGRRGPTSTRSPRWSTTRSPARRRRRRSVG